MKELNVAIKKKCKASTNTAKVMIAFFIITLTQVNGSAQTDSIGVYKTANDFQNKKLSYSAQCNGRKNKIRTHDSFSRPFITVIRNGKRENMKKYDLYGYRDCKGNDYRFFINSEYTIVNTDKFYLYTQSISESGESSFGGDLYFFSLKPDSRIIPMSKHNLMTAFRDNKKFVSMIDVTFKRREDLDIPETQNLIIKMYELSLE